MATKTNTKTMKRMVKNETLCFKFRSLKLRNRMLLTIKMPMNTVRTAATMAMGQPVMAKSVASQTKPARTPAAAGQGIP